MELMELEQRLTPRGGWAESLNHLGVYGGPPPAPGTPGGNLYAFFHPPPNTTTPAPAAAPPPPPAPGPAPAPVDNADSFINHLWAEMPGEWRRVIDAVHARYVIIDDDLLTNPATAPYGVQDIGVNATGLVIYEPNSGHYTMYLERAALTDVRAATELFAHEAGHLYSQNLRLAQPPHPEQGDPFGTPMASQAPQFVALAASYGVSGDQDLEETYAEWFAACADPNFFVAGDDINAYFAGTFGPADWLTG